MLKNFSHLAAQERLVIDNQRSAHVLVPQIGLIWLSLKAMHQRCRNRKDWSRLLFTTGSPYHEFPASFQEKATADA
jgi:hypothetical protein